MLVGNVPEHWLRAIAGCVSQRRYPSGLGLTTLHRAHTLIIFCTLDALSPAMQSRHNCETNDWDCGSSNSDTESGSDNGPSPPSSDIDPHSAVLRTHLRRAHQSLFQLETGVLSALRPAQAGKEAPACKRLAQKTRSLQKKYQ